MDPRVLPNCLWIQRQSQRTGDAIVPSTTKKDDTPVVEPGVDDDDAAALFAKASARCAKVLNMLVAAAARLDG